MDFELMVTSIPRLLEGAVVTLQLVSLSLVLGIVLAVPLALCRVSRRRLLWMPVYGYIFYFRGTPLLVQIFLIYYGLGQFEAVRESFLWPVLREAYWCAIIAFTMNTAAYTAEILRGGILAVPAGEVEAARATGMSGPICWAAHMPRAPFAFGADSTRECRLVLSMPSTWSCRPRSFLSTMTAKWSGLR